MTRNNEKKTKKDFPKVKTIEEFEEYYLPNHKDRKQKDKRSDTPETVGSDLAALFLEKLTTSLAL